MTEVEEIITQAAALPLQDAAYELWRQSSRLDRLEGRPTPDQVRAHRAMSPAEQAAKRRYDRDHAQDGPSFTHVKRAYPKASETAIKQAIIAAVKFDTACFKYFSNDHHTDFWERCVRAVACAAGESPGYLESTCQAARNHVAYYMK